MTRVNWDVLSCWTLILALVTAFWAGGGPVGYRVCEVDTWLIDCKSSARPPGCTGL